MKKWLPHLIVIVILTAGVWYVRTHDRTEPPREIGSTNTTTETASSEPCSGFSDFSKAVANLQQNNNQRVDDMITNTNYFPYKRAAGEPYVLYESTKSVAYIFEPDSIDRIQRDLTDRAAPELEKLGFQRDQLQDTEQRNGFDTDNQDRAFLNGFRKGEDHYMAIFSNIRNGEHTLIEAWLDCGETNPTWDEVYDDVIAVSGYGSSQVIGPVTSRQGLDMVGNGSGYAGGGGVTEYWVRTNNNPRKIHVGQDYPPCEVLERNKVGKGLDCLDVSSGQLQQVSY